MLRILYYPDRSKGPVKDYQDKLEVERPEAHGRWMRDLEVLGVEGLHSPNITVRPIGNGLWELKRLYDGIQYRLFFVVHQGAVWLLHNIEKKSKKTPKKDLRLAFKRLRELTLKCQS